jgi:hypothetical protein
MKAGLLLHVAIENIAMQNYVMRRTRGCAVTCTRMRSVARYMRSAARYVTSVLNVARYCAD